MATDYGYDYSSGNVGGVNNFGETSDNIFTTLPNVNVHLNHYHIFLDHKLGNYGLPAYNVPINKKNINIIL